MSAVDGHDELRLRRGLRRVTSPVQFVGFWTAVSLPFLYVPLLYGGLAGEEAAVFLQLLCLNAVALVLGHGYGREARDPPAAE